MKLFRLPLFVLGLLLMVAPSAHAGVHQEKALASRPWQNEVFYQIQIDRYSNSGSPVASGRAPNAYWGGNIKGITAHLDDLSTLGVTTLLLTPVTDSLSYHGYDVMDLSRINPHFGTIEDYRDLIHQSHARGIRVLFDFVSNHMSDQSPAFAAHPDWFRPKVGEHSVNGMFFIEKWTKASFFELPDLIQEKKEVYDSLLKAARLWIREGIDGFRMDAVTLIEPRFWKRFNADIKKSAPLGFLVLGEIFSTQSSQLAAYAPFFDASFDFRFYEALQASLWQSTTPQFLTYAVEGYGTASKRGIPVRFLDNHDTGRNISLLLSKLPLEEKPTAFRRARLGFVSLLLAPGIPSLLYGSEILLTDVGVDPHQFLFESSRSAMRFEGLRTNENFHLFKKLIAFRKDFDFNRSVVTWLAGNGMGPVTLVNYRNPRSRRQVLAILNFSSDPTTPIVELGEFPGIEPGASFTDILSGKTIQADGLHLQMPIGAWGAVILDMTSKPGSRTASPPK